MANSATLTFGYTNTDFTRKYTFNNLSAADCAGLKAKVLELNASIEGGTYSGGGSSGWCFIYCNNAVEPTLTNIYSAT